MRTLKSVKSYLEGSDDVSMTPECYTRRTNARKCLLQTALYHLNPARDQSRAKDKSSASQGDILNYDIYTNLWIFDPKVET